MGTLAMTGRCGAAAAGAEAREAGFFRARGYTPAPQFIQWMATLRCTMHCAHCLAADDGAPDMPLRDVERLLDGVARMGVAEFLVTGGEPATRPDLDAVIDMLAERGQRWSLNTAALPDARTRAAMEKHPPSFVAVSLDGPEGVHDRFRGRRGAWREAMEAIRFYRGVSRGRVVAGTTVTRLNFPYLEETFALAASSGADAWGLHLLVPEGRAARARRLFLRRREMRALLDFCAARRTYFPVGMADEIGYLGPDGPLVRDGPFLCGAGRTQCVVLPDGEVVPCTTLDRSASAGNVLRDSLERIWAEGFEALRAWEPEGRCRSCEYAPACRGGCWLQRRRGRHCSRHLWHSPRLAATAAGMAVALGLGAAAGGEPSRPPQRQPAPQPARVPATGIGVGGGLAPGGGDPVAEAEQAERRRMTGIETVIAKWYAAQGRYRRSGSVEEARESARKALDGDPAGDYFLDFTEARRARGLAARCAAVRAGLGTRQVSLSLAALMWRDLTEACLEGPPPAGRSAAERKMLAATMAALGERAQRWQRRVFVQKLEPFLGRQDARRVGAGVYGFKGGPRWPAHVTLQRTLEASRWRDTSKITHAYIDAHPFGAALALRATCAEGAGLVKRKAEGEEETGPEFVLGIFEMLRVPAGRGVRIEIEGGGEKLAATLPAGSELAYADVLRLLYEGNREALDKAAEACVGGGGWRCAKPLLLPALHALGRTAAESEEAQAAARALRTRQRLAEIWLF